MELLMMKRNNIARFVFALAAVFLISGHSYGFDLEKKVVKTKLKNGLTVLMLERHLSPTVSLYIRHRIGAADETDGETAPPIFCEHMMFKGTTTIGTKNYTARKKDSG